MGLRPDAHVHMMHVSHWFGQMDRTIALNKGAQNGAQKTMYKAGK